MVFALFSRGYRRGGFNAILVGQPQSVLDQLAPIGAGERFGQERLDNFEVGVKSTWLDGAARTRVIGYYQLYRNGQVPSTISFVQPNGGVVNTTIITNGGQVDLYGLEVEADWAVTENWTLNATFNYQPSDIGSYNYIPVGNQIRRSPDISGNNFWGAPVVKWTFSPVYTAELSGDWEWFASADWKHRGKYYIDGTNLAWLPPSEIFDAHLGIRRGGLSLEAYVLNLLDQREFSQGEYGADSSSSTGGSIENEIRLGLPKKREFGVKAIYSF
jgi:iron complex outermembrane receptor protein